MKNRKRLFFIILTCIVIVCLTALACYKILPLFEALQEPENQEQFKSKIDELGWKGWLTILFIQILQIFIAFIPGEIVEVISGILYGPFWGLITCLLGITIASILIYFTVKLFANKYVVKYKEKLKTYSFLNNPKKIHAYLFIIFFTPGLPKDIFIYLVPFLPIRFTSYLIIALIARIPTILSSTIVGDSLVTGDYLTSIIIFTTFAICGLLGFLFGDKIFTFFSKHDKDINNNDTLEN